MSSQASGTIPGVEGLAGRARQEAVYKKAYGEDLFDRDATAYYEVSSSTSKGRDPAGAADPELSGFIRFVFVRLQEGTKENPIPILSIEPSRIVGISLPDDATIRWFTLKAGELAYDPNTCNFFALKQVTKEEVDEWVQRAEKQVVGGK
jgi:hypothetical protein